VVNREEPLRQMLGKFGRGQFRPHSHARDQAGGGVAEAGGAGKDIAMSGIFKRTRAGGSWLVRLLAGGPLSKRSVMKREPPSPICTQARGAPTCVSDLM